MYIFILPEPHFFSSIPINPRNSKEPKQNLPSHPKNKRSSRPPARPRFPISDNLISAGEYANCEIPVFASRRARGVSSRRDRTINQLAAHSARAVTRHPSFPHRRIAARNYFWAKLPANLGNKESYYAPVPRAPIPRARRRQIYQEPTAPPPQLLCSQVEGAHTCRLVRAAGVYRRAVLAGHYLAAERLRRAPNEPRSRRTASVPGSVRRRIVIVRG